MTQYLGKQWHPSRSAFRLTSGQTSYSKRLEAQKALAATKAREREMKDEKEAERQVCLLLRATSSYLIREGVGKLTDSQRRIQAIRDKRAAKEEKERYEKMAEKMHRKRVERVKRREKRNKLLKS